MNYICGTKCKMNGICVFDKNTEKEIEDARWDACRNTVEDIFDNMKNGITGDFVNKQESVW